MLRFKLSFKLREKILLSFALLAIIPIVVTSVSLWLQANNQSELAIEEQVEDRLLALNEIKKGQIQGYYTQLYKQIRAYSVDPLTVVIIQALSDNFNKDMSQVADAASLKTSLIEYYKTEFTKTFEAANGQPYEGIEAIVEQFDNAALTFQDSFIARNEAPFGEKFSMLDPDDGKLYNSEHASRHMQMQDLVKKLDIADVYLVNPKGHVVYSMKKNIDFGTNLKTGPFKDTALGRVYNKAIESGEHDHVSLSDFEAYLPAFNEQAAFIASPIQDMLVDDAFEILGVLVFRIPTTHINDIMTNQQKWEKIGLGTTGQTYLVSGDNKLRSMSRHVYETLKTEGGELSSFITDANAATIISAQKSAIGQLDVSSKAAE
ncbi:MAG: cache domain-containing protein, partial [Gammaproteobacteria bacterium]|nr:cache domain-containing protein [Gammaproteobacteria bacterium]